MPAGLGPTLVSSVFLDNQGTARLVGTLVGAGGGGGGGLTKLFEQTLGADAATIDTGAGGIPATSTHLLILATLRGTNASISQLAELRFNGDAANNYSGHTFALNGNADQSSVSGLLLGSIVAATADANVFSDLVLFVPFYNDTVIRSVIGMLGSRATMAAGQSILGLCAGRWNATTAVSQLTFILTAATYKAGSHVVVYGI